MADDIKIKVGVQSTVKQDMDKVVKDVKKTASKSGGLGKDLIKELMPIASVGAAIAAVKIAINSVSDYADAISNISDNTGASMKGIQNLAYAAGGYGIEMADLEKTLSKVSMAQNDAFQNEGTQKALKRLGIGVAEFVGLKPEEAFQRISKAMTDTGDKAAAMDIIGKSGLRQIGFMKEIAGGINDAGLASEQNIKAIDSFFDTIGQKMMKLKAAGVDKLGQLLRGDIGAFMGATPEIEAKQAEAAKMDAQNEKFAAEKEAKFKEQLALENEAAKKAIKEGQAAAVQRQNEQRNFQEAQASGGVKQDVFGRLAGRQDRTMAQDADYKMRLAMDPKFRQSEKKAERESERQRKRGELLSAQAAKANLDGTLKNNPKLRRIFEAEQAQLEVKNLEDNLKQRQLQAAQAQIDQTALQQKIADNTAAMTEKLVDIFKG